MPFRVAPTSPNNLPISSLPLARPHFGKYTWASSANRSRIEPPVDVTPPLSNAFRYSIATDLRCSSVMVCLVSAMVVSFRCCGLHQLQRSAGRDVRRGLVVHDRQLDLVLRSLAPLAQHQRR